MRGTRGNFWSGPIPNHFGCVGLEVALSKESPDPILGSIRAALFESWSTTAVKELSWSSRILS